MTFATKNKTKMTSDELTAVVVNNYLIIDLSIQIILFWKSTKGFLYLIFSKTPLFLRCSNQFYSTLLFGSNSKHLKKPLAYWKHKYSIFSAPVNKVELMFQIEIKSQMQFPLANSYTFSGKLYIIWTKVHVPYHLELPFSKLK